MSVGERERDELAREQRVAGQDSAGTRKRPNENRTGLVRRGRPVNSVLGGVKQNILAFIYPGRLPPPPPTAVVVCVGRRVGV